jgi:TRAP-type mannitol/chloroaromatic compound transport system permease small subunit
MMLVSPVFFNRLHIDPKLGVIEMLVKLVTVYGTFLRFLGLVAGVACCITMAMVAVNVIGRYGFNMPFDGAFVYAQSLLTITVFFSLALTQFDKGHIKVSFLTRRMTGRFGGAVEITMLFLGFLLFALSSYATLQFAIESFEVDEQVFDSVQYPIYPIKFVVFFGLLLLAVQFALDTLCAIFSVTPHKKDN